MSFDKIFKYCGDVTLFSDEVKLSASILFKIEETTNDFYLSNWKEGLNVSDTRIDSFLPYENLVLEFNDGLLWMQEGGITKDKYIVVIRPLFLLRVIAELKAHAQTCPDGDNCIIGLDGAYIFVFSKQNLISQDWRFYQKIENDEQFLEYSELNERIQKDGWRCFYTLQRFLQFLSCKNIRTIQNHPPLALQKARQKRGKKPLFSYYTLQLDPLSSHQSEKESKGLWSNRVHLCRGHFKEYTADKPLFGRLVGRFWFAPHARGNKSQGVIHKDYELAG